MSELPENWIIGLVITIVFSIGSYLSKKIDLLGALTGGVITFCMFLNSQWLGILALTLFFGLGTFVSHWKVEQKRKINVEQENKGKRTIVNAVSNGGFAGLCGFLGWFLPEYQLTFELMMIASIASAMSDTFSSELGNVYGRRYINILTFKSDIRGKDGVISLEGTIAGLVGAAILAILFVVFRGNYLFALLIILCGMIGNFSDSILGATLQQKDLLDNHQVNLVSTIISGLIMFLIVIISNL
jgi:uncharacterized protein (TIGR00297 family)